MAKQKIEETEEPEFTGTHFISTDHDKRRCDCGKWHWKCAECDRTSLWDNAYMTSRDGVTRCDIHDDIYVTKRARLHAAADDLLHAAKNALTVIEGSYTWNAEYEARCYSGAQVTMKQLRDAIAKAEGK